MAEDPAIQAQASAAVDQVVAQASTPEVKAQA